jgi:hypothetical protein
VVLYDVALNADQVQNLYTNQKAGTNHDGSTRVCGACGGIDHFELVHDGSGFW